MQKHKIFIDTLRDYLLKDSEIPESPAKTLTKISEKLEYYLVNSRGFPTVALYDIKKIDSDHFVD